MSIIKDKPEIIKHKAVLNFMVAYDGKTLLNTPMYKNQPVIAMAPNIMIKIPAEINNKDERLKF